MIWKLQYIKDKKRSKRNVKTAAQASTYAAIYPEKDFTDEIWMHEPQVRAMVKQYNFLNDDTLDKLVKPEPVEVDWFSTARNLKLLIFAPHGKETDSLMHRGLTPVRFDDRHTNILPDVRLIPNEGQQDTSKIRPGHVVTVRASNDPEGVARKYVIIGNHPHVEYLETMKKAFPGHAIVTPQKAHIMGMLGSSKGKNVSGLASLWPSESGAPDEVGGTILDVEPYKLPDTVTEQMMFSDFLAPDPKNNVKNISVRPDNKNLQEGDEKASKLITLLRAAGGNPIHSNRIQAILNPLSQRRGRGRFSRPSAYPEDEQKELVRKEQERLKLHQLAGDVKSELESPNPNGEIKGVHHIRIQHLIDKIDNVFSGPGRWNPFTFGDTKFLPAAEWLSLQNDLVKKHKEIFPDCDRCPHEQHRSDLARLADDALLHGTIKEDPDAAKEVLFKSHFPSMLRQLTKKYQKTKTERQKWNDRERTLSEYWDPPSETQ
jgi:hypothetical protein